MRRPLGRDQVAVYSKQDQRSLPQYANGERLTAAPDIKREKNEKTFLYLGHHFRRVLVMW